MPELKILNSREIKEVRNLIEEQWGAKIKLEYGFLKNSNGRIFIVSREISNIDVSKLRINSAGMYFCELNKGIRLSIEGSQMIGHHATKNIAELDDKETIQWLKGEDIEKECSGCSGFVLIKNKNDFMGTGRYSKGKILNYIGKTRRISA